MKLPRSQRSGERNGAERRFRVGVRHHYLGTGCGLALSGDSKARRHSVGVLRGRCGTPPAGMGSAVWNRREGKDLSQPKGLMKIIMENISLQVKHLEKAKESFVAKSNDFGGFPA